jgi:hypothetical protein
MERNFVEYGEAEEESLLEHHQVRTDMKLKQIRPVNVDE